MSIGFTDRRGLGARTAADGRAAVTLTCRRLQAREKAILVADQADPGVTAWLPRSELLRVEEGLHGLVRLTLPRWLALEKGLVSDAGAGQGRLF